MKSISCSARHSSRLMATGVFTVLSTLAHVSHAQAPDSQAILASTASTPIATPTPLAFFLPSNPEDLIVLGNEKALTKVTLMGRVMGENGRAVANVRVAILTAQEPFWSAPPVTVLTDSKGEYVFKSIKPGVYNVLTFPIATQTPPLYSLVLKNIPVMRQGETTSTRLPDLLVGRAREISGVVQDANGKAVSGAGVQIHSLVSRDGVEVYDYVFQDAVSANQPAPNFMLTDAAGRFRLFVPETFDTISVSKAGFEAATQTVVFPNARKTRFGARAELTMRLKKIEGGLTIRGVAIDEKGQFVPQASLEFDPAPGFSGWVKTDENGEWTWSNARAGEYTVSVSGRTQSDYTIEESQKKIFLFEENAAKPMRIILNRIEYSMRLVRGRVLDIEGKPLANVKVYAYDEKITPKADASVSKLNASATQATSTAAAAAAAAATKTGVYLGRLVATTNAQGEYEIEVKETAEKPLSMQLNIVKDGYVPISNSNPERKQDVLSDSLMVSMSSQARGRVLDEANRPVANAYVILNSPFVYRETKTDSAGAFLFQNLPDNIDSVTILAFQNKRQARAVVAVSRDNASTVEASTISTKSFDADLVLKEKAPLAPRDMVRATKIVDDARAQWPQWWKTNDRDTLSTVRVFAPHDFARAAALFDALNQEDTKARIAAEANNSSNEKAASIADRNPQPPFQLLSQMREIAQHEYLDVASFSRYLRALPAGNLKSYHLAAIGLRVLETDRSQALQLLQQARESLRPMLATPIAQANYNDEFYDLMAPAFVAALSRRAAAPNAKRDTSLALGVLDARWTKALNNAKANTSNGTSFQNVLAAQYIAQGTEKSAARKLLQLTDTQKFSALCSSASSIAFYEPRLAFALIKKAQQIGDNLDEEESKSPEKQKSWEDTSQRAADFSRAVVRVVSQTRKTDALASLALARSINKDFYNANARNTALILVYGISASHKSSASLNKDDLTKLWQEFFVDSTSNYGNNEDDFWRAQIAAMALQQDRALGLSFFDLLQEQILNPVASELSFRPVEPAKLQSLAFYTAPLKPDLSRLILERQFSESLKPYGRFEQNPLTTVVAMAAVDFDRAVEMTASLGYGQQRWQACMLLADYALASEKRRQSLIFSNWINQNSFSPAPTQW